ncbi:MAG: hypothetical protein ACERJ2_01340 [Filomicrobium sp.]
MALTVKQDAWEKDGEPQTLRKRFRFVLVDIVSHVDQETPVMILVNKDQFIAGAGKAGADMMGNTGEGAQRQIPFVNAKQALVGHRDGVVGDRNCATPAQALKTFPSWCAKHYDPYGHAD